MATEAQDLVTVQDEVGRDVEPKTRKGRRSKRALLDAARVVFRERGFAHARVSDMAAEAGMSNGAFYRYFKDKHDILMALLSELSEEMYEFSRVPWQPGDPKHSVRESTLRYMELYRDNADLMRVEIEVAQTELTVHEVWRESRAMFFKRIARSLRRGQKEGIVRKDIDPDLAASLLGGMTEHYAYLQYVLKDEPQGSPKRLAEQISRIWANGVYLTDEE
ncbi:MAG: TetR family transcriptional regulator [Propionibacteriales bacterium]|nr:TetR family transcriptional regulator [Propionibacteriales bacterium]